MDEKKLAKIDEEKVVLESGEEGGYTIYVPSVPACISEGDTFEEAITNIREAIEREHYRFVKMVFTH